MTIIITKGGRARTARREVKRAMLGLGITRSRTRCDRGGEPMRVTVSVPADWALVRQEDLPQEVPARLAPYGEWEAALDHARRLLTVTRVEPLPDLMRWRTPPGTPGSEIAVGEGRGSDLVTWDPSRYRHFLADGWAGVGKTALARLVVAQWPGNVLVFGHPEWEEFRGLGKRTEVVSDHAVMLPALERAAEHANAALLLVVDGLDDHLATAGLSSAVARLAVTPGVHLLATAHQSVTVEGLRVGRALRVQFPGHHRGRALLTSSGEPVEFQVGWLDEEDSK